MIKYCTHKTTEHNRKETYEENRKNKYHISKININTGTTLTLAYCESILRNSRMISSGYFLNYLRLRTYYKPSEDVCKTDKTCVEGK
jgi:hypothetical protein